MLLTLFALCGTILTTSGTPLRRANTITASSITALDPSTCSCANAPVAGQCRTATEAAPEIAISFVNFAITTFGEQAALLALMLYESGAFKYSTNVYPGVPGQGTRDMQMPEVNSNYAEYLANVCTNCGITAAQVQQAEAEGPTAVLDLVNTDEWGFGSAAWFLATQCDASIRDGLAAGTEAGWDAYLQQCIRTTVNDDRTQLWSAAIALKAW
ncbi:hypothetical protein LTR08_000600 [Meristemomyces frigidus]|nr:hypothetical protein LTR08_000600 [Meristemomyces frigidus]